MRKFWFFVMIFMLIISILLVIIFVEVDEIKEKIFKLEKKTERIKIPVKQKKIDRT